VIVVAHQQQHDGDQGDEAEQRGQDPRPAVGPVAAAPVVEAAFGGLGRDRWDADLGGGVGVDGGEVDPGGLLVRRDARDRTGRIASLLRHGGDGTEMRRIRPGPTPTSGRVPSRRWTAIRRSASWGWRRWPRSTGGPRWATATVTSSATRLSTFS